mmetsp:Transcript_120015/g.339593  ORF Transcript_120015/g.339593 Transcript_120015/m.339593 type:complete len:235 (-) Transcript_120015:789-1493(-)
MRRRSDRFSAARRSTSGWYSNCCRMRLFSSRRKLASSTRPLPAPLCGSASSLIRDGDPAAASSAAPLPATGTRSGEPLCNDWEVPRLRACLACGGLPPTAAPPAPQGRAPPGAASLAPAETAAVPPLVGFFGCSTAGVAAAATPTRLPRRWPKLSNFAVMPTTSSDSDIVAAPSCENCEENTSWSFLIYCVFRKSRPSRNSASRCKWCRRWSAWRSLSSAAARSTSRRRTLLRL